MNLILPVLIIILGVACLAVLYRQQRGPIQVSPTPNASIVRYVALGDSYTIGEGVSESERWPNVVASRLGEKGTRISVVANIARTGWTTQNLLDSGMPLYAESNPQFVTLQIGVNDWVQKVDAQTFRARFNLLLDGILEKLPSSQQLVVVTIPDFGATPSGKVYGGGRDISTGILQFNSIVQAESHARSIAVVDIFSISQGMKNDLNLINWDGLHPSAKEYSLWADAIYPYAEQAVTSR